MPLFEDMEMIRPQMIKNMVRKLGAERRGEKAEQDSGLLVQFLDLPLDVFPHVAVEGKV